MFAAKEIILLTLLMTCIMEMVAMINGRVDITVKVELTILVVVFGKMLI